MINIAVVEDDEKCAAELSEHITKYADINGLSVSVVTFASAESFLFSDIAAVDLIFMDIQLPNMDGMTAVKRLREKHKDVGVVFVTSLAQFAVNGYEVGALDFIVKPVTYYNFALKFGRIINCIDKDKNERLIVKSKQQTSIINVADIYYVEIVAHVVTYHTANGSIVTSGTMKKVTDELKGYPFALCNQCYLVSLRYVTQVDGDGVTVNGKKLAMSRPRRREFMHALNEYISGHGGSGGGK